MKSKIALLTILVFSAFHASGINKKDPIRLLNWWEYLSQEAVEFLEKEGHHLNVTTYKSNEVAISQLITNKENIDVVIVSNQIIPSILKDKVIYTNIFDKKSINSEYHELFKPILDHCVPYLWSTTIFVLNTKQNNLHVPTNIAQLRELKKQKITIATIDDKFETLARIQAENQKNCPVNKNAYRFPACDFKHLKDISLGLLPSEFTTSIADIIKNENTAAYGWHGETGAIIDKKTVSIALPDGPPIVGFDAVCIVKNRHSGARLKQLKEFAQTLGSRKVVQFNVARTQYFSPYINDNMNLRPEISELFNNLNTRIKEQSAIMIYSPSSNLHSKINMWWKKIRYGK
ncbi:MAG: hypothetical protein AABY53_02250 [Bdellovibrionota bacterium]